MFNNNKAVILIIFIVSLTTAFARDGVQNELSLDEADNDVMLLASFINSEAGNGNYLKQLAVGAVVVNRLGNDEFPDTLAGVIYQPGAFDSASVGMLKEKPLTDSCIEAARDVLNGWDPVNGALHFWRGRTTADKSTTTVIEDYAFGFITGREIE